MAANSTDLKPYACFYKFCISVLMEMLKYKSYFWISFIDILDLSCILHHALGYTLSGGWLSSRSVTCKNMCVYISFLTNILN